MILSLSQLREDYKSIYKSSWPVAKKLDFLIQVTKLDLKYQGNNSLTEKQVSLLELLSAAKITLRTLQRWKRSYRKDGLQGLMPKIRGHKKAVELSFIIRSKVRFYRSEFRWGSEVIQAHLLRDYGLEASRYKIERYLDSSGLKKKYPCSTKKKQRASRKKKHTKKVYVSEPGTHTQMDVKYQIHLLQNGKKAYVYNFVDHASNWSFKYAYSRISAQNTKNFMEKLLDVCPFPIKRLQTDNGIEFTFKWASKNADDPKEHPLFKFCFNHGITHKLIPPGEKESQGLVERSHRQDDQELFSRIEPYDLSEFNQLLEGYYKFRNRGRRFKKLRWKSPDFWLQIYYIPIFAQIFYLKERYKSTDNLAA